MIRCPMDDIPDNKYLEYVISYATVVKESELYKIRKVLAILLQDDC